VLETASIISTLNERFNNQISFMMKVYDDKHIKNIVLLGSHGCGKTTLAETMLYEAGLLDRRGKVETHNTVSDHHPIEHERNSSVHSSCLHTEWRNYKINIIDTPGLDDLVGQTVPALRVADTCVLLLSAQHGVEVGTDLVWNHMQRYDRPVLIAVNQLDHSNADFDNTVEEAKAHFGSAVTVMQYPVEQGEGFHRIIDLLKMTMYVFKDEGGKPEKHPIPESELEKANALHRELVEKAAENDESLMELYFEKGDLNENQLRMGLKIGMMKREVFPVFCLSSLRNMGSGRLMGFIDNVAPSALEMPPVQLANGGKLDCTAIGDPVLFIFKTILEPRTGQISVFKVLNGTVHEGTELINSRTGVSERIGQLFILEGKQRKPVEQLAAGDIGCTLKLKNTATADTLHTPGVEIELKPIDFPQSRIRQVISAVDQKQDEKMHQVVSELSKEDPTLIMGYVRETGEQIISAQGELHLQLLQWRLANEHGIAVDFHSPKVSYRETIRKPAEGYYRHKKQSGGAGQFAEVQLQIDPWYENMPDPKEHKLRKTEVHELPTGGKLVFCNCIVGGVIDSRFIPSVLKGILETMKEGPLTKSPARDIRVILYDGKMHAVDSNDVSFKTAGAHAFKEAFLNADPQLLEPIQELEVRVPEDLMGDVMTDLQSKRSTILGMEAQGRFQVLKTLTPLAELDRYSTTLRSLTQGMGVFNSKFHGFEIVPTEIQRQVIDRAAEEVSS
jgi:elongation factor G